MNFVKKIVIVLSGNLSLSISSLAIVSILVSRYSMKDYGVFVVYQSIFMALPILTRPITWHSIVKFKNEADVASLFKYSLFLETKIAIISVSIINLIYFILLFSFKSSNFIFLNSSLFIFITFASIFFNSGSVVGYFRSKEQYNFLAMISICSSIAKVIVCLFFEADIINVVYAVILIDLVIWFSALFYLAVVNLNTATEISSNTKRKFLKFSLWGNTHAILDLPVSHLDRLIVSVLFSTEAAGLLNLIKRVGGIITQLSDPITQVLFPKFVDVIDNKDYKKIQETSSKLKILSFSMFPIVILFGTVFFDFFDSLLFNSSLSSIQFQIMTFSVMQLFLLSYTWIHPLCTSISAMKDISRITLISNTLYIVSLYVLCLNFDMWGLILSSAIQYSIVIYLKYKVIKKAGIF